MGGRKRKERRDPGAARRPRGGRERSRSWLAARAPVLRYFAVFGACVVVFYVATATPWFRTELFPAYLELNARLSAALLSLLGETASAEQFAVVGERFVLEIRRGCDAIEPSALYAAAVVAAPSPLRSKALGLALGLPLLLAFNLVRIVSLYYTGVFAPGAFETVHVDVWQPLFILLALVLWIAWILWSTKHLRRERRAAG